MDGQGAEALGDGELIVEETILAVIDGPEPSELEADDCIAIPATHSAALDPVAGTGDDGACLRKHAPPVLAPGDQPTAAEADAEALVDDEDVATWLLEGLEFVVEVPLAAVELELLVDKLVDERLLETMLLDVILALELEVLVALAEKLEELELEGDDVDAVVVVYDAMLDDTDLELLSTVEVEEVEEEVLTPETGPATRTAALVAPLWTKAPTLFLR
ncbi:hypothetical protein B0A54_01681 [Friedmanniomyces endolithicus]|uniref:Uncharacterized protein n=1 Tax=Friedmanniomyces endolithicus TaxID=329885 RepID=A0A4U0VGK1_9PEZI|nr:hypothetical protein B0A54_01681 [Friedmanniomyces endolithicus]